MEKYTLKNGINVLVKNNKNTPRVAVVLYAKLNRDEEKAGLYYLLTQLLYQGTITKTSEELANILDENAIDLCIEKKADYIRFKVFCLNEDINLALEILQDIIENSTFKDYEKEIIKIKGEFESDLDSAKIQAQDNYYRTIFKNHPYGIGRKEIIEEINSITKEDLLKAYEEIKYNAQKNISVAGDIDNKLLYELLEKHFCNLKIQNEQDTRKEVKTLEENLISTIEKEDANQAQIFKGWIMPNIYSDDYASIVLLNTILGSSGLSSRLFLELREKQGLAYTVRSVFEPYILSGSFFVYIATEPKNIKTSLDGFKTEIDKIMSQIMSDEELKNAKNNAIGKRQFYKETNMLEASLNGYYEFLGLGYDFEEKLIEKIKTVTKEQIMQTAEKYFSKPHALSVLAPKEYLKNANLLKLC